MPRWLSQAVFWAAFIYVSVALMNVPVLVTAVAVAFTATFTLLWLKDEWEIRKWNKEMDTVVQEWTRKR